MTVLKGPDGRRHPGRVQPELDQRARPDRGDPAYRRAATGRAMVVDGHGSLLGTLPGHAWSNAFGINDAGLVSGWSRQQPENGAEENPVVWPKAKGKVVALRTAPNRADGIAEQTNGSGASGRRTSAPPMARKSTKLWSGSLAPPSRGSWRG